MSWSQCIVLSDVPPASRVDGLRTYVSLNEGACMSRKREFRSPGKTSQLHSDHYTLHTPESVGFEERRVLCVLQVPSAPTC